MFKSEGVKGSESNWKIPDCEEPQSRHPLFSLDTYVKETVAVQQPLEPLCAVHSYKPI